MPGARAAALRALREKLKPGDSVRVPRYDKVGRVVRVDLKRGIAVVSLGLGQWEVTLDEVFPPEENGNALEFWSPFSRALYAQQLRLDLREKAHGKPITTPSTAATGKCKTERTSAGEAASAGEASRPTRDQDSAIEGTGQQHPTIRPGAERELWRIFEPAFQPGDARAKSSALKSVTACTRTATSPR